MYKIVYCTDDGKRESTQFIDVKSYGDVCDKVKELIKDSSVLDIYVCRQVQYINAYVERYKAAKYNLSSAYGMVVSK